MITPYDTQLAYAIRMLKMASTLAQRAVTTRKKWAAKVAAYKRRAATVAYYDRRAAEREAKKTAQNGGVA